MNARDQHDLDLSTGVTVDKVRNLGRERVRQAGKNVPLMRRRGLSCASPGEARRPHVLGLAVA